MTERIPVEERQELGQFFTPLEVARFMAKLARPGRSARRMLDPGAGVGLLASALRIHRGPLPGATLREARPPITTIIYTHPSDEELYAGIRDIPC